MKLRLNTKFTLKLDTFNELINKCELFKSTKVNKFNNGPFNIVMKDDLILIVDYFNNSISISSDNIRKHHDCNIVDVEILLLYSTKNVWINILLELLYKSKDEFIMDMLNFMSVSEGFLLLEDIDMELEDRKIFDTKIWYLGAERDILDNNNIRLKFDNDRHSVSMRDLIIFISKYNMFLE